MHVVVFITAANLEEAQKISKKLVEEKYAACANIVDSIKSVFWWENKVDQSQEVLLILKTRSALFPRIEKVVKSLHSYSVPEIIALPIIKGQKDYLKWIDSSVRK